MSHQIPISIASWLMTHEKPSNLIHSKYGYFTSHGGFSNLLLFWFEILLPLVEEHFACLLPVEVGLILSRSDLKKNHLCAQRSSVRLTGFKYGSAVSKFCDFPWSFVRNFPKREDWPATGTFWVSSIIWCEYWFGTTVTWFE